VFAWLIRTARRHIREAGVIGVIIAILLIGAEVMHRIEWLETNYPSIAEILHKVVDVAHIVEAAVVVCAIVILICFLVVKTMRKARLPVSPPSLGVERLLVIPDPPDPQHYRFRMAQHEGDLEPFVQWSDNEMEIAHRHPDLSDDKRRKLYLTWFRLRRESFLVLERFNHGSSRWDALALSIALPLTEHGRDQICRSQLKIVDVGDSGNAVIARQGTPSSCFLIDTWIVKPRGERRLSRGKRKVLREEHETYGIGLVLVHLSVFWDGRSDGLFLVEADNRIVARFCRRIGFLDSQPTEDGEILQSLSFPYTGADGQIRRKITMIAGNVATMRTWPITGHTRP
jgi:hypothetical protein